MACIKDKKTLSLIQKYENEGKLIDFKSIEKTINKEMKIYKEKIKEYIKARNESRRAITISSIEYNEIKETYRRIVKLIYPDIAKDVFNKYPTIQKLFYEAIEAYKNNDLNTLMEVEVKALSFLKNKNIKNIKINIPNIEEKIEKLKEEIEMLKNNQPYTYIEIIKNKSAIKKNMIKINEEYKTYLNYDKELKDLIKKYVYFNNKA